MSVCVYAHVFVSYLSMDWNRDTSHISRKPLQCQTQRRTTEHHCGKSHVGRFAIQLLYVPSEIAWAQRSDETSSRPPSRLVAGLGPNLGLGAQQKFIDEGRLGGSAVEHLPLAQGMIPGFWDRVPHPVPHRNLLLPLPLSLPLSVSFMNK